MIKRKKTKKVMVGPVAIGGGAPISVQSMCNTDTRDVDSTVKQIKGLEEVGCELIRVAVPDMAAAKVLGQIKKQINIPLIADIHYAHDLALESVRQGVDKLRINPGNIGSSQKIKEVVQAAKDNGVPIRIGVNAGSLEKDLLEKFGKATAAAMVESALRHISILEKNNFEDIIIALKASDVERTIQAYTMLSEKVDYPLHIGITEAGTKFRGTVLSSVGLGYLLLNGIGDTLRVSLTDSLEQEVRVGWEILKALKLRQKGVDVTSCPTCGRTEIDVAKLAREVEKATANMDKRIDVAVMGCVVNGPGEAREKDLAIIGGKKVGLITKRGKTIKKVPEDKLLAEFLAEIEEF